MQDAPFTRGHRCERKWPTGQADLLNGHFGHETKFPVPGRFETLSVKGDVVVFLGFEAEDLCRNVLDGMEKFAVAGSQEGGIWAA